MTFHEPHASRHAHYCPYARHRWECDGRWCSGVKEHYCLDCESRRERIASVLRPVRCERCKVQKLDEFARPVYMTFYWGRGKRLVCPSCAEAEETMQSMGEVTGAYDDDWIAGFEIT